MTKWVGCTGACILTLLISFSARASAETVGLDQATAGPSELPIIDAAARQFELQKGHFAILPLDFMPSRVIVGDPKILGVDVYMHKSGPSPFVYVVGQSPGTTNIAVFGPSSTPRISIDFTVGPATYGMRDQISVFRGTKSSEFVCSRGQCDEVTRP